MAKRIFSFVIVLALLLSLMPQMTIGVFAEGALAPGASEWCDHTSHDGWTAWGDDSSEEGKFPSAAGKYYLTADLELTDQATVSNNIHLCLNDHTITQKTSGKRHIYLNEGKGIALSIYDCGTNGKITGGSAGTGSVINVTRTNTFNLYGGKITGNNSTSDAVIYVQAAKSTYPTGGVFNMYGGEISGNKVKNGVIYGAGGEASYTNTQVNIYGGTIKDNEATVSGGAIFVKTYGTLHVENATITGNKAGTAGSAIYAEGRTPITIKNTTITGNIGTNTSASGLESGWSSAVYLCGVNNPLTVSGKVIISGNTTAAANIADLTYNSENYDTLLVNQLATGSNIKFKTNKTTAANASEVIALTTDGAQSSTWQSEWVTYVDATGATKNITYGAEGFYFVEGHYHGDQKYVAWSETDKLPSKDGESNVGYYLENDVTVSKTANKSKVTTGTLHLCLNGKTVSQAMTDVTPSNSEGSDIFRVDGGALYMSDCTTVYDENGYFVSGGKITGGVKKGNGAALYINKAASIVEVTGIEFSGNVNTQTSEGYGGAAVMARYNTTAAKFVGCKFDNNQSKNISTGALVGGAGALALRDGGKATVEKCLFTNNKAKHGAAILCTGATLTVKDSKFTGNTGDNAVAINIMGTSNVTIDSCTITGNSNTSADGYGAVNLANGASNVYLIGKTVIYDNLNKDGKQQNLHLQNNANLDYDVSGLTAGAKVGVSFLNTRLESGDKFFSTTGMTSNPGYCISDHAGYEVVFNSETTRLELAEKSTEPEPSEPTEPSEPSEPTEPSEPSEPPVVETHTHKLCNDASCTSHGDAITFEPWGDDEDEKGKLPTSGNWYLTENVKVSAATAISAELNLCLNGKTVTQTASARIYTINVGGKLSITDCAAAYTGDTYTGGVITGGKHNTGSAVYVSNGTTFNLYGGRITNCGPSTTTSEQTGAAVFLHSANSAGATFNMYGGEITNCGGTKNWGGAISNGGGNTGKTVYVNIYGGKIFNNTAKNGAAIRLQTAAVATIYGGEIYGNHATDMGGAIYLNKSGVQLNLQGGNIHDNTAASNGGGIYVNETAGQITVSGTPNVQNNKVGTELNNLSLGGEKKIVVGDLKTGAKIGLTVTATRAENRISTAALASEDVLDYFTGDNADLKPAQDAEGYLILGTKVVLLPQVHKLCNDASCTEHADVTFEPWTSTTTLPSSGNYYLVNDVNVSAATSVSDDLNLCLNGKTITQTTANRIFNVSIDKTLSITDCGTTGTITGGENDFGSVTYLNEGATFNLFAGKLTGNGPKSTGAATGAVVFLRSAAKGGATFNMYGGEITGNGGENCWGGAASNGSGNAGKPVYVNMYGGKIYGNTALNGGAFRMMNDSQIAIYGGEIYNNTATVTGGAIYIADGAELKLEGGKIYDNTAATNGGGIYANAAAGMITLSNTPSVENNKVGAELNNLFLAGDAVFTVNGLQTGAKIGLSRDGSRASDVVSANVVTADDMAYFTNDDTVNYQLKQKNGYVALTMQTEHMHKICNDAACADHAEETAFVKWEKTDSLPTSGSYYLTVDVQLSEEHYKNYAVNGTLNLCLNGHTVTAFEGKRVMMTAKGSTLNLTDCNKNPGMLTGGTQAWGAAVNINAGSTFNMYGGKISGNKCLANAGGIGAIYIQGAGSVFNMYGGEISGNESAAGTIYSPSDIEGDVMQINIFDGVIKDNKVVTAQKSDGSLTGGNGSAIYANANTVINIAGGEISGNQAISGKNEKGEAVGGRGTIYAYGAKINITGGAIKNNHADVYAGGVFMTSNGTEMNMSGGEISGNTSVNGAGVMMQTRSVFNMTGGKISGNMSTKDGAGIYVSTNTDFTMTGGEISGNKTEAAGGGIFGYRSRVNLLGGKIVNNVAATRGGGVTGSGNADSDVEFKLGGNIQITENKAGDMLNNLYLTGDRTITVEDLKAEAKIGVRADNVPRAISKEIGTDWSKNFVCDSVYQEVTYKDKTLYIDATSEHMHCVCVSNATACDHSKQKWVAWESTNTLPTESGNYYLTADVQLSAGHYENYAIKGNLSLCLNGHTITAFEGKRVMMVAKGGTLNLTDCNEKPGMLTGGTQAWGAGVNINAGGVFNMFGGKISGNKCLENSGGIGAIYVQGAGATFNMYGGEVSGNEGALGTIYAPGGIEEKMFINIYGGSIENNKSVRIKNNAGEFTKSSGRGGAICINGNVEVNIYGGTIKNNEAEDVGGGIFASGENSVITMYGGEISGNKANNGGGLITQTNSQFILKDGLITGNETKSNGAGAYISTNTTFVMEGGKITANNAKGSGAGFYALRSKVTLNGGEISDNVAGNRAGGFGSSGATMEINKITIKKNSAKEGGAAYINRTTTGTGDNLKAYPSIVNINEGALITENKADTNCGGILMANDEVVVTMNGGEISKNTSSNGAGVMTWKGSTFVMKGGKITNHNIKGTGGGMYVSTNSTFKMEGGQIVNNTAKTGGGVYILRAKAQLSGGTIGYNYARQEVKWTNGKETKSGGSAGGIYISGATVTLNGTAITGNKADSNGGGIVTGRATYKENGVTKYDLVKFDIYGGSVSNNTSNANAGGMLMQSKGTVVNVYGGTFTGNKAASNAGAIYVSTDTTLNMTGGTITGNHAEKSGGAFYCYKSTANITGGEIHHNTATTSAGMLNAANKPCVVTIKNIKIYGNEAKSGGALVTQSKATLYVENCEIYENQSLSGHGGAVFVSSKYSNGYFTNCKFYNNKAAGMGGAVYASDFSDSSYTNCEFYDNYSPKQGGALMLYTASTSVLEDCIFRNNLADDYGGAIAVRGDCVMTNVLVENNTSKSNGGGIATDVNSTTGSGIMKGLETHNCQIKNNTADGQGGGFYIGKGCRVELYDTEITGNKATLEGSAIWAYEDLELHNVNVTGNTSGSGYAVYMADSQYDGHSYFTSRNKLSGNVVIKDNEGGNLFMGKDVVFVITADGLGQDTYMDLLLHSGTVTNRIFGAYNYEGGDLAYVVTAGDRSITDPEVYVEETQPEPETTEGTEATQATEGTQEQGEDNTMLYVGIAGIGAVVVLAAAALVIVKKKKANKAESK